MYGLVMLDLSIVRNSPRKECDKGLWEIRAAFQTCPDSVVHSVGGLITLESSGRIQVPVEWKLAGRPKD